MMSPSPLLRDIRKLDEWEARKGMNERVEYYQQNILQRITSLAFPHEIWDVFITKSGAPETMKLD